MHEKTLPEQKRRKLETLVSKLKTNFVVSKKKKRPDRFSKLVTLMIMMMNFISNKTEQFCEL